MEETRKIKLVRGVAFDLIRMLEPVIEGYPQPLDVAMIIQHHAEIVTDLVEHDGISVEDEVTALNAFEQYHKEG